MSFVYHKTEEKVQKPADIMRTVVLGVGNVLLKDEGVGIHVIHGLQDRPLSTNVDVIDGGTSPDVFYLLEEADKLIIIDAVVGGGAPGAVYRFQADDVTAEDSVFTSLHQMGLLESLTMMEHMGNKPKDVVIIGVEPKEVEWGLELSPELEQKMPQILSVVLQEIGRG